MYIFVVLLFSIYNLLEEDVGYGNCQALNKMWNILCNTSCLTHSLILLRRNWKRCAIFGLNTCTYACPTVSTKHCSRKPLLLPLLATTI